MPFPAYYQEIWKESRAGKSVPYEKTALKFIVKTARFISKMSPVSIPDEVNALAMARSLANLRGKGQPGVYELIDGVQSCFVKGDINMTAVFELDYLFRILSGIGAGSVAASDIIPPIVINFRGLCREYRIKISTIEKQETTLDIVKNPHHYSKSCFFHQLDFLGTGFCKRVHGPDYASGSGKNLVREIWEYRYGPSVETTLIDISVYGVTLSEACGSIMENKLKQNISAAELGTMLISAEVTGIDGFFEKYQNQIYDVIDRCGNFIDISTCLIKLRYLKNLQNMLHPSQAAFTYPLIKRCFEKSVELLEDGRGASETGEREYCEKLASLHALTLEEDMCPKELLRDKCSLILSGGPCNSRFYGTLLAVHFKQGEIGMEQFALRINAMLTSSMNKPEDAASFIAGVFLLGRDAVFSGNEVLAEIDRFVAGMDFDTFMLVLPNLRYAFTGFLPSETDRLAKMVASIHGIKPDELRGGIVTQDELALAMLLDEQSAEAMNQWGLPL
jgi:hypothetical protein